MTIKHSYKGSNVALITPMFDDGAVDYDSLNNLIDFHIEAGTSSIVSVGTTGESATVGVKEHLKIINHTIQYAARRIPIIAGTGANSTSEAIELTQEANNVPGRTAVDMSVETTARLSEISNIIGIKDATGDLEVIKSLVKSCPEDFLLLTGDDATAVDFLLLGGHGGISVTANVTPKELQKVYMAAIAGNADLARKANEGLTSLHQNLFVEANPIPVKWALYKMGMCSKGIRLPLLELSTEFRSVIENDLKELNLV
jgi:4-hydroxy-tetrahydrodipicolinate synthase